MTDKPNTLCPFCGNDPRGRLRSYDVLETEDCDHVVACRWCWATGPTGKSRREAIALWKQRAK